MGASTGRYESKTNGSPTAVPPLMNFHLLIGDASSSTFAPVKTEIKMYLSLIKRIHVPRFALSVGPRFTNHLWPRDLNKPASWTSNILRCDL